MGVCDRGIGKQSVGDRERRSESRCAERGRDKNERERERERKTISSSWCCIKPRKKL